MLHKRKLAVRVMPYALHTMPPVTEFTHKVIGGIIYLNCIGAGTGFFIMVNGLKVLGPAVSAIFSNFLLATAMFLAGFFQRDDWNYAVCGRCG